MDNPRDVISVERIIAAAPEEIFTVIANPARHPDFDGSNSVVAVSTGAPERLSLGDSFQMSMKRGVGYSMISTVTEFEDNRLIAWAPKPARGRGTGWTGRVWRYELEPVEHGTKVTETWDISEERTKILVRFLATKSTRKAMSKSLEQLDSLVTQS
jgi:uncharacterized protein YndB with AHSA1/START domain